VPAVRHYYKLTLAPLPAPVGAAVYWRSASGTSVRCARRRAVSAPLWIRS